MIGKKYSLGSTAENGEARVKLANFDELKGQSEDVASFLGSFSPDQNFTYLHVIAMGAGEYYGCNINGDYFPERDLINRHKTFETNAKVFKEHDNKPYSPDYGHVAFAWYNPKMHRVELILAIDNIKGKEFVDRQAKGEQLEVSMGCKVLYDVCSICGNKAKKASDYCNHIRYDKKKIYPDGKQPYMINYNPTFFDISIVRRRADRIAYVLSKVASVDSFDMRGEIAENYLDDTSCIPEAEEPLVFDIDDLELGNIDVEVSEKKASIMSDNAFEKLSMIKRITANAVKVLNDGAVSSIPMLEKVEPDIPNNILDIMAKNTSFENILKSFAVSGIPMKPREAARIIIIQRGFPYSAENDVLSGIMSAKPLPTIDRGIINDTILNLLSPFLVSRSSYLPAIAYRMKNLVPMFEKRSFRVDVPQAYYNLNPNLSFGMVRNPEPYNDVRGVNVPQMHTATDIQRPALKDPTLTPTEAGIVAGALYAAYKERGALWDLIKQDPKMAAAMAVIAAGLGTLFHKGMHTKTASVKGFITKGVIPFVGAHFISAHYRNKYNQGQQLNGVEQFIAENPDILSIAAPLAVNMALHKKASVTSGIAKDTANDSIKSVAYPEDSESLVDSALTGIIFHSDRHSALSGAVDSVVEAPILGAVSDAAASLYKSHIQPIGLQISDRIFSTERK